jgi:hypothetical protein
MVEPDEQLRATAIHEAGHAVAICRTGGQILQVTLNGQTALGHWERPTAKDLAIYHFAGSAAEARYLNRCFEEVLDSSGCGRLCSVRSQRSQKTPPPLGSEDEGRCPLLRQAKLVGN